MAGGTTSASIDTKAITGAADFQQITAAFTTLIGDAAKAKHTLGKLHKLGAKTPFELH
jgi:hypothetical protein